MQLIDDVRYSLRQFASAPGFTATAVLTLALGIGATTAIFSLVHAVLLKSLPVAKPSELYRVGDIENCCVNGGLQDDWSLFSYDKYRTFRDGTPGFVELAAFESGWDLIGVRRTSTNQPAESQSSEYVSGNYFAMFGIGAYAGRMLTPQDDRKGADPVAVMSYRTWQQKYGQDPTVMGGSFTFNGRPFTVVGVAPPGFFGDRLEHPPAFWIPLSDEALIDDRVLTDLPEQDWLDVIGRIKPGADAKQIEAHMQVELQQWLLSPVSKLHSEERALVPKQTLHLSPGGAGIQMLRDEYKDGLHLLMAISAFVLLIACANVANLMLVRAANRKQQTSIRAALGAPRSRQIALVLTESTVLALLGGIIGVAVAFAGTRVILHLAFQKTPVAINAAPSWPVLGFTFAVALLTGIAFGVAPAWMTAAADPADALRSGTRLTGGSGNWTQKSLVVAQAALSLVLLCAAGLLVQSLRNMHNQHFGFETSNRYILEISPEMAGYKPPQLDALYRQLHENLTAIPGVAQVSFSLYTPMQGNNWGETAYLEGQAPPPPDSNQNNASWVRVSEDYFGTLGTKIIQGRAFSEQDTPTTRNVAVVNQTFAKRFFKNESPIGKHFGIIDMKHAGDFEIVGVTGDTMYWEPTAKMRPMYFLPARQWVPYDDPRFVSFENNSHYLNAVALRTTGSVPGLESQVRRALAQVNPDLAVIDFTSFSDQVEYNFSQQEMIARLTSLFGILALVLASVGLYGVTSYSVERRTNEIGIRMALGADRVNVLKLVLQGAFLQIAVGLAIGIPATILGGRAVATQLFGVKPYDPRILLLTTLVLSVAALIAALVPARRAASLEPMRALRTE
ncbi:MAG TPA: ABC transporter permease [Terriglobales bacterium]|nr:ABC transporter permease [Terriglobales bacterium]